MKVKPPFRYFGGKTAIAERIAALLPPHEHYVEPFAGSLAVLLAKPPSPMETVNDLDGDLMTFWRVLRDRPEELEQACALTPHSRAEYGRAYYGALCLNCGDEIEQARRVWVRLTQGRRDTLLDLGWRYNVSATGTSWSTGAYLDSYLRRMPPVAARLRSVALEHRPALDVIAAYGGCDSVLLYADPPYLAETRGTHGPGYQIEQAAESDHRELADALCTAKAAVVLSGYPSPLYDELYGSWHQQEIRTRTGNGGTDCARTEVLWSNRPFRASQATFEDLTEVIP
jgi:DNA adenine methylase